MADQPGHPCYLQNREKLVAEHRKMPEAGRAFAAQRGDGQAFEWGVDYLECGIVKFLRSQGADKSAPHLCLTDYALFGALGIGLPRTQTLANGDGMCDFRFKWGGDMCSGWLPPWLES
jgi:hypothetical protein